MDFTVDLRMGLAVSLIRHNRWDKNRKRPATNPFHTEGRGGGKKEPQPLQENRKKIVII